MNVKQLVKSLAEKPKINEYEKKLADKRGNYREWLLRQREADGDAGIPGDVPEEALILYGDEDLLDENGQFSSPWFRPDWSPELLDSCFYLGSVIVLRKDFLEKELGDLPEKLGKYRISWEEAAAGAIGKKMEGLGSDGAAWVFLRNEEPDPEYQTVIRELCRKAGGWEKGCRFIVHVPEIWHHQPALPGFSHFEEMNGPGVTSEEVAAAMQKGENGRPGKLLSVIIPSKDNPVLLSRCISALRTALKSATEKSGSVDGNADDFEILVVDNGSNAENRQNISKLAETLGFCYLYESMEFDFAKMCNLGAKAASGEYLLFLNDDVELLPESHLERMMGLAGRPGVGSVGIKLRYPDSTKIQHAGITNLPMGPVHKLQFLEDGELYYHGMNRGLRNVMAVTAACVVLRADRFWEAGGFDEGLKVAFNDVALGLRLYQLGYRNVCMCDAHAFHHESMTRGNDEGQEKLRRLLGERDRLFALFPELCGKDPYYPDGLGRRGLDVKVRPAYETMKNQMQSIKPVRKENLGEYREDECLCVRVEDEREGELTGYALVLGDDNACYVRRLLFQNGDGAVYAADLEPQYRPDLEENLPDQKHVALCGFWGRLEKGTLPSGTYRIGAVAERMVGNLRLLHWTNRFLETS